MSRPTWQEGVNLLFDYQVRRENAALLEKTRELEQLAAETKQNQKDFEKRLAAIETNLLNIKNAEQKDRHGFEKCAEDIAALKSQMGVVVDKMETYGQQPVDSQREGLRSELPSSETDDTLSFNATETPSRAPGTTTSLKVTRQHPPSSNKTPKVTSESSHAPITPTALPLLKPDANTSYFAGPMTRTRSRSRSGSQSTGALISIQPQVQTPAPAQKPAPTSRPKTAASSSKSKQTPDPTILTPQPTKLPRLHQGHSSLTSYLASATYKFKSLPKPKDPKDTKLELEFIAAFIMGIVKTEKRDLLVEELQQVHPSRTKKGGKIEILCRWEDVAEVMKSVGLLDTREVGSSSGSKSGRSTMTNELAGLLKN